MLNVNDSEQINKVSSKINTHSNSPSECSRCEKRGHISNSFECPARNAKCNKCSLLGHFAVKCRTKKRKINNNNNGPYKRQRTSANVRCVSEEDNFSSEFREFGCFKILNDEHNDENICCIIGGKSIPMVIDSGCRFNLISENDWNVLQKSEAKIWNMRSNSANKFKAYAATYPLEIVCF